MGTMILRDGIDLDVAGELARLNDQHGEMNYPDGTSVRYWAVAENAKQLSEVARQSGNGTWFHIFQEAVAVASAQVETDRLRTELIRVMAVCRAWIEAINRREGKASDANHKTAG